MRNFASRPLSLIGSTSLQRGDRVRHADLRLPPGRNIRPVGAIAEQRVAGARRHEGVEHDQRQRDHQHTCVPSDTVTIISN
jgi:hypothetical protein